MAKQNAAIYGVLEKIEFVVGDFFKLANQIKDNFIVTSPPWGGPEYNKKRMLSKMCLWTGTSTRRCCMSGPIITMPYQTSLSNRSISICITHSARMSGIV